VRVAWLHQVHGAEVVRVDRPGQAGDGDGLVTTSPDVVLLAKSADCATLALAAEEGVVGVAHAGWQGVTAGIVEAVADAVRAAGGRRVTGAVGPSIGPCCYEFGAAELDTVAAALGDGVRALTTAGRPALDLRAAAVAACARAGVELLQVDDRCTACHGDGTTFYSHRARGDQERHGVLAWLP
jgi:YfiH family protein